jgi:beta-glucuronidase
VSGGWWNYGGLLREVYLRRSVNVDWQDVMVRPVLSCATCGATVAYRVTLHNVTGRPQAAGVHSTFGGAAVSLGSGTIPPRGYRTFRGRLRIAQPHLWSPTDPYLYDVVIDAGAGGATARYTLHSGIRSIAVRHGHLYLNGLPLHLRGVALHEDDVNAGAAVDNAWRLQHMGWAKDVGATVIRAHYPLHPELLELADRLGILVWDEVPVYQMNEGVMSQNGQRRFALRYLRENIVDDQNHPSIMTWSVSNELTAMPGRIIRDYYDRAGTLIHRVDPTRPASAAILGYPSAGCRASAYRALDLIGLNDYFGWYFGPEGSLADPNLLPGYLDYMHRCLRGKAIMITEFGAEADRHGPPEERGSYEFQTNWLDFQSSVFASKPWLSGAIYFALQEFRVAPMWSGGNPRPNPPWHEKGLISYTGFMKPAYFEAQKLFRGTQQIGGPVGP